MSIVVSISMIGIYRFTEVNFNIQLNYSDMESIYSSVAPLGVYINEKVEDTGESTSDFTLIIQNSAGSGMMKFVGQDWPPKQED